MRSYCESKNEGIDATVGGLVWIRRPNGSWWPGQILGPDALPKSCSVPLRGGTPVKMLGREDGSLVWYNFEKSKRVKAFRCGEYDKCIEKVKASSVNSSKKRNKTGKYARREDAILRALELEKAQYSNENQEFCLGTNSSVVTMGDVGSGEEQEKPHSTKSLVAGKKRWKNPNDSEGDGTTGGKRMRGLQDLGPGKKFKRKFSKAAHLVGSRELVVTNSDSLSDSNIDNGFSSLCPVNCKDSCISLKRRRHQMPQVHESIKRKNRRRPLIKVLESTARVTVTSFGDRGGGPARFSLEQVKGNQCSAGESAESKKTDHSVVINSSLDCSATSCEVASLGACVKNSNAASCGTTYPEMKANEHSGIMKIASYGCFEGFYDVPVAVEKNTSRDGLVGCGNTIDNSSSDESLDCDDGGQMVKYQSVCVDIGEESILQTSKHTDLAESKSMRQKAAIPRHALVSSLSSMKCLQPCQTLVVHCSSHQVADAIFRSSSMSSSLYDVNLDVRASYQGPHIPLVSLMSKSSGKAVVGHPISVEVLQNDLCDKVISSTNCCPDSCSINASQRASTAHASGIVDVPLLQCEDDGMVVKLHPHLKFQRKPSSWLRAHQSPTSKNSLKIKKSGSLLRKTRKLSSINVGYECKIEDKAVLEKLRRPVVACVPLKVVFSRISEALSCPRQANSR